MPRVNSKNWRIEAGRAAPRNPPIVRGGALIEQGETRFKTGEQRRRHGEGRIEFGRTRIDHGRTRSEQGGKRIANGGARDGGPNPIVNPAMKGLDNQGGGNNQASQEEPTQDQFSQGTNMEVQHAQRGMAIENLETTSQVEETKDDTVIKNSKISMERVNSEPASEEGETGDLQEKVSRAMLGRQGKGGVEATGEIRTEGYAEDRGQETSKEMVHNGQKKKGIKIIAEE
ncbi:hypothetical protein U1Q18_013525 [Sarracenia purpurea var. burkii]